MEHYVTFIYSFSCYIFMDLPFGTSNRAAEIKTIFETMWRDLRLGAVYFLHYSNGQHTRACMEKAQEHLRSYAAACEKVSFDLFVVHLLICCRLCSVIDSVIHNRQRALPDCDSSPAASRQCSQALRA